MQAEGEQMWQERAKMHCKHADCGIVPDSHWEDGDGVPVETVGFCCVCRRPGTQRCKMGLSRVRADASTRAALGLKMSKLESEWWP